MKNIIKKLKGKKVLSMLLALIMVLSVASPAFSPIMGIIAKAAASYPVELAFENIFVFEQWASNQNSTRISSDGAGGVNDGTLSTVDVETGSFRLTNKTTTTNVYTTASMGTGDAAKENAGYYSMAVEAGATYAFSFNVSGSNLTGFYPFVFFYDASTNEMKSFMNGAAYDLNGNNSFNFTVPDGIARIQVRFQIPNNTAGTSYADVKNIAIYKVDAIVDPTNLYDFDAWYDKSKGDGDNKVAVHGFYGAGTASANLEEQSVTLTTNNADQGNFVFTKFSYFPYMDSQANNGTYYTIDADPNTNYTFSYHLINGNLHTPTLYRPYVAYYSADGNIITYLEHQSQQYGDNSFTFTTPAGTDFIQVIYALACEKTVGLTCTVKNVEIHKTDFVEHKVDPTRKTYTYTPGGDATYGTLPNPPAATIPEGYIFAGWYTGADGTGIRIASDTKIQPKSYTVYPKFEPAVDSLTVATMPSKTEYTVGEKLNTAGLVLQATVNNTSGEEGSNSTFNITSGYYCTPEYLTSTGTQTITAHYGGKTATFTVNVSAGKEKNIVVNGATQSVTVANNEYTLNYTASPFNRYELTYTSDSYVKGEISMDGITEEFFLEPSDNGSFASYIDSFLRGINHYSIDSIKFTCLDKEYGNFELKSLTTISSPVPSDPMQYYENDEYKVGINISFGGVVSYIEDLKNDVRAAVYTENGKDITKVDYADNLPSGAKATSDSVNLINTNDRGRYLQQSYYGTSEKPYEMGDYNGIPWNYNPVQGGNLPVYGENNNNLIKGNESSKVIDYRITADQIYVKTRPLDWGKNSVDYPDSYITDSYMEAWYVFEDGMIKTYCRFVDYSGYPSNTTTQEMPALYTIEPLNHFVYNDVSENEAWSRENLQNIEEPEFWGVLPEYNALLEKNGKPTVNPDRVAVENWAAFTAGEDENSYGIGVYSPGVTDMHFGTYPSIYNEEEVKNNKLVENYRHAQTIDPAVEGPTSYISPVDVMTFESYKPSTYSFYITTGTANEIYEEFKTVANKDNEAELAKSKIAVPETVYMTPANGASKVGQYYVNNIMDENNNYNIKTEAVRDAAMYFGLHVKDAKEFSVKVTNVTDPSNDIFFCNTSGSEISESTRIPFGAAGTYENDREYGLRFSGAGLQPGEKATAKWEITIYLEGGKTETYTAYTVLYAPGRTVGAVAEARQIADSVNEISSWITGATGVDHSKRAPLGSLKSDYRNSGYFRVDPLVNPTTLPTGGSSDTAYDYILGYGTPNGSNDDYTDNAYVMQTATSGHDSSRSQSYLGLLTVDKSRYTNTDQIPNLKIGFDVLRTGSYERNSLGKYTAYYTLGTSESFTATDVKASPSGWTTFINVTDWEDDYNAPHRDSIIPSFAVSTIDGKYIHALNQGLADQTLNTNQYSTAGTSVLCSVTDKGGLRDAVLNGYTQAEDAPEFVEALEKAATVLGDPSATQSEIDEAKKALNNALESLVEKFYALKYDNLFSAYEFSQKSGSMTANRTNSYVEYLADIAGIKVISDNVASNETDVSVGNGNNPDIYYNINVTGSTEYIFEYDVETNERSQLHLFFFDSDSSTPNTWLAPTNRTYTLTPEGGTTQNHTQSSGDFANVYASGKCHVVMRFTTPANADVVSFRFGNAEGINAVSTFTNIRFVEADKYYTDVEGYTKTEDVYKEFASYGTLPTLERTGFTFAGWSDVNDIGITGATIATEHRTIYSQWNEHSYTIVYNANGGNGSVASQTVKYSDNVTLPNSEFSKTGYKLIGWSTSSGANSAEYQPGQTVSGLTVENGKIITLYAVWAKSDVNVTFDNLIDLSKWNTTSANNGKITNVTDTGFTLTSNDGAGEATSNSDFFSVEPGKQYKINIDFEGDGWDVYIFFCDASGNWIDFSDGTNRFSSNGSGVQSRVFTAPDKPEVVKAQIRVDANGSNNTVTYNNIRVWEDTGITVSPVNKVVGNGNQYGDLPIPTRTGYKFDGWKNAKDQWVNESDIVNSTTTVNLYSNWTEREYGIFFNTNGGSGEYDGISVKYTDEFTLPNNLTADGAKFLGWSLDEYAISADYKGGETISVSQIEGIDADNTGSITFHAVWELTADSVSADSAVADFGLAITINPYGNDTGIFSHHALTVADKYDFGFSTDNGVTITATATGTYGNFSVDKANYTIVYTPTRTVLGIDEVTLYSKLFYEDGSEKILTNTITVAPASNVYYEETFAKVTTSSDTLVDWAAEGEATITIQEFNSEKDIYGHDSAYENSTDFSDGTYYQAVVDATNKMSETASFTFKGKGVDLITACGYGTGLYTVKIKNGDTTVKNYLIDTYTSIAPLLYQVPIVTFRGDYGTYTVETTAVYLKSAGALSAQSTRAYASVTAANGTKLKTTSATAYENVLNELEALGLGDMCDNLEMIWLDDNSVLNGGTGATVVSRARSVGASAMALTELTNYIDGFRVYNPLDTDSSNYIASEKNADYYNIVNSFVAGLKESNFVAFAESVDENGHISFTDYSSKGAPKGEVYLRPASNDTIAFKVQLLDANSKVMIGARAVNGATKIRIDASVDGQEVESTEITLNSFTEMYYDISDIVYAALGSDTYSSEITITITNVGSEGYMLAINNLKLVNSYLVTSTNRSLSAIAELMFANRDAVLEDNETEQAPIAPDTDEDNTNADNTNEDMVETPTLSVPNGLGTFFGFLEKLFEIIGKLFNAVGIS